MCSNAQLSFRFKKYIRLIITGNHSAPNGSVRKIRTLKYIRSRKRSIVMLIKVISLVMYEDSHISFLNSVLQQNLHISNCFKPKARNKYFIIFKNSKKYSTKFRSYWRFSNWNLINAETRGEKKPCTIFLFNSVI